MATKSVDDALSHLRNHEENGAGFSATITGLDAFAVYNTGWIERSTLYEKPSLVLALDTDFGELHAEIPFTSITDGNLHTLLSSVTGTDDLIDCKSLNGERIHVAPNDDFSFATLYPEESPGAYEKETGVPLFEPDDSSFGKGEDAAGEPRSIEWLNNQLRIDFDRYEHSEYGWLERSLAVEKDEQEVRLTVSVFPGWGATWTFDTSLSGAQELYDHADMLGLSPNTSEWDGETVYIRPARDVPAELPRTDFPMDDLDRWVMAGSPMHPDASRSLTQRVKTYLSSALGSTKSGIDVSVSSSGASRLAKSSDRHDDIPDESRPE